MRVQAEPAQPLRLFTPAPLNQEPGQLLAGSPVAGIDPGAQPALAPGIRSAGSTGTGCRTVTGTRFGPPLEWVR